MYLKMWKIKQLSKVSLTNPTLIVGLPGMGNVGKLVVDTLVEKMNAQKVYEFFSYSFPASVFVNEENIARLPMINLYAKPQAYSKDLLLLGGDLQPTNEQSMYEFSNHLLKIIKSYEGSEIITVGGIGVDEPPENPRVFGVANCKKSINSIKVKGINWEVYGKVGPIVGVSGVLLGLADAYSINSVCLLAETVSHPLYLGLKGAKKVLKVLNEHLNLNLNVDKLCEDIINVQNIINKHNEKAIRAGLNSQIKYPSEDINYIG